MPASVLWLTAATAVLVPTSKEAPDAGVTGSVVDGSTSRPISGAIVTALYGSDKRSVLTDEIGRFALPALPAGRVSLSAQKPGYVGGGYGQRFPRAVAQWIDLAQDEVVTGVTLRLWKYGVVSGTVQEPTGEPAVGVIVQALRRAVVAGAPRLVADVSAKTDDRGIYRIVRLIPGTYIISLPAADRQLPAVPGKSTVYPTTFFPQTTSANAATQLRVESGDEQLGIDFQRISRETKGLTVTVSGARDRSQSLRLTLIRDDSGALVADVDSGSAILTPEQSSVTFPAVAIGSYVVRAFSLPPARSGPVWFARAPGDVIEMMTSGSRTASGGDASATGVTLWAESRFTIDHDMDVLLNLAPAARVTGRFIFDGASPRLRAEQFAMTPVLVSPSDGSEVPIPLRPANPDGTFDTGGLPPGRYIVWLAAGVAPWTPTSTEIGGHVRDCALVDVGVEDVHDVTIRLTDRPTIVRGTIKDGDGRIRTDASAYAFPVATALWSNCGALPVVMQEARANRTGVFELHGLPPGEYFVGAAVGQFPEQWRDPDFLRRLVPGARRLRLGGGDQQMLNLEAVVLR